MGSLLDWLAPHLHEGSVAPAQRFLTTDGWQQRTYGDLFTLVERTALLLHQRGAGREQPVAILANTSPEWTIVDLAAAMIGAPVVPIYPTASREQVDAILAKTTPAVIVTDRADAPAGALPIAALDAPELTPAERETIAALAPTGDDIYSVVFSSGSSGDPKGCVLTHANYVAVLRMAGGRETHSPAGAAHRERAFVYLPLAHVSARLQQLTTFTLGGELVYGAGSTADLLDQIGQTHPTYVPGVPRFFESAYLRAGREAARLREMFGPALSYALTGGAPIDAQMLHTYAEAGITLVEGYGLTETSAALTLCAPHDNRPGSVGRALDGVQLRIAPDGEILARGENIFAGYWNDPEQTRATFTEDGWFATGDLGRLDDDGYLFLTGRKKNLLITSTGKNIAPEPIENRLRASIGTDDVLLVGDARPFLTALVFDAHGTRAIDAIHQAVSEANLAVAPPERVRKVAVVPRALSVESGSLTASGKIVRHVVTGLESTVIDALYAGTSVPDAHLIEVEGPRQTAPTR